MRALVITPTPTHPTNQGNRARVTQIASALKQAGAQVEVLYFAIDGLEDGSVQAMREAWDTVYIVAADGFVPRRKNPSYWGLDEWVSPQLVQAVRFLADSKHYDVVVVNYVWCSALLPIFDSQTTLRVLDTHDAFGDRHKLSRAAGIAPHWFYTTVAEEARGLDRADLVLAIQEEEGAYFRKNTRVPVEVVEYSAPTQYLAWHPTGRTKFGYIGSANPWNLESVRAFDKLLFEDPLADALRNKADFLLFGGITKKIGRLDVFHSMGTVADVKDAYAAMDVVINPMLGGTGLKIKTVEALAYGRPIIATQAGGAGLEEIHADLQHDSLEAVYQRLKYLADQPKEVFVVKTQMQQNYQEFSKRIQEKTIIALTRRINA
jgi:glycosyltransferase involved in cell wall biosynthesis